MGTHPAKTCIDNLSNTTVIPSYDLLHCNKPLVPLLVCHQSITTQDLQGGERVLPTEGAEGEEEDDELLSVRSGKKDKKEKKAKKAKEG